MTTIELYDVTNVMLIVLDDSSPYVWSNQVGGIHCDHPEVRGVLLPTSWIMQSDDLWTDLMLEERTSEEVDDWLKSQDLEGLLEPRSGIGAEAWIPVRISATPHAVHLKPFASRDAILTYENSD